MAGPRTRDFPPGLQGGLEHDDEDHRLGETGQTGPESPGDIDRSHPDASGTATGDQDSDGRTPAS